MSIIGLKAANCKNCYKCVKVCPVKSIKVSNAQAQIIDRDCVLCGTCLEQCPQNAKTLASDAALVKEFIKRGERVILSVAPSYYSSFEFDDVKKFASSESAWVLWRGRNQYGSGLCYSRISQTHAGKQDEKYHYDMLPVGEPSG